ncbi:hypothetical protein Gotur_036120 [Gossypium turneri]
MVIHLRGAAKKLTALPGCHKCGDKRVQNGEIAKVCIDCFLDGATLQIFDYGVSLLEFIARKPGTCSKRDSKPPHEVISTATDLLERNGFGPYDMLINNCEDFAAYCKTGSAISFQIVANPAIFIAPGIVSVVLASRARVAASRERSG